jgi:hypothetical protein
MGKMIQRLFWVCQNGRIDPYRVLYWTEDYVECSLTVQAEELMRDGHEDYGIREHGKFQFNVSMEESMINLRDGRFVWVF